MTPGEDVAWEHEENNESFLEERSVDNGGAADEKEPEIEVEHNVHTVGANDVDGRSDHYTTCYWLEEVDILREENSRSCSGTSAWGSWEDTERTSNGDIEISWKSSDVGCHGTGGEIHAFGLIAEGHNEDYDMEPEEEDAEPYPQQNYITRNNDNSKSLIWQGHRKYT